MTGDRRNGFDPGFSWRIPRGWMKLMSQVEYHNFEGLSSDQIK